MSSEPRRDGLDASERFYAHVVHSLDGIVWEADAVTFQFLFVSRQAESILGYSVREWLEDPAFWRRHTHPEDVEWCTAYCLDATAHERNHSFDYRMIAADGRAVWLRDIVTVQARGDGSKRLVGIMLDISEQKRAESDRRAAEEQVKRGEEWFRRLIEHAWDTTLVVDRHGVILFVSPAITRVLGFAASDLTGSRAVDLATPADKGRLQSFLDGLFEIENVGRDLEYRARHRDNSERVLETFAARSRDQAGREVAILNARDITEKKALESQLMTSQKMEAIGLLAGGIAHDFNNLLTVIRGYADMLWEQLPAGAMTEELAEIRRAADRASVLTQQLLAFSRKQVVRPSAVDVNATITDLSTLLARVIGEHIQLHIRTAPDVPPIVADPGQFEQVLMNLAVNARDAMPFGGELTIAAGTAMVEHSGPPYGLAPGRYASITVSDTGAGIAPEIQPRIFEPFFTTKEPGKGTGLGLSTAYGIVRQSHGHIDVQSQVGRGTTFTLYFPASAERVQPKRAPDTVVAACGTETILLVEDEAAVRQLAVRILVSKGYRVVTAGNGSEALETCRLHGGEISLLITDVVMPGLSGPELAARVAGFRPGIRVIFISGYAGDAVSHHGIMEPGVSFVAKPFTAQILAAKVREVLDGP